MIRIDRQTFRYFILLIPVFIPGVISVIPHASDFFNLLSVLFVIYLIMLNYKAHKKIRRVLCIVSIMYGWIVIKTVLAGESVKSTFILLCQLVCLILVIEYTSNSVNKLLSALMLHGELCVYLTLFSVIIFPSGMIKIANEVYDTTKIWYVGYDHIFVMYFFPAVFIAWIYKDFYNDTSRCYKLTLAAIICIFLHGSTTGQVGIIALTILCAFPSVRKIFTPFRTMIIISVAVVFIVVLQRFDFLAPILVNILNKDMTFSSRLFIWSNAIKAIKQNVLTGYGYISSSDMVNFLGNYYDSSHTKHVWQGATHCHCNYLQILFQGGLISFVAYVVLNIESLRVCTLYWKNSNMARICTYGIIVFSLMSISEPLNYARMYIVFILCFYISEYENSKAKKLNNFRKAY